MSIFKRNELRYFIFISILILSSIVSIAQPVSQRASDAITVMDGNLFAKNSFRPAVFQDTTAGTIGLDSCGKLIFTLSDNSYWIRACSPKRWVKLLKTGDVANATWGSITGTLSNQTDLQNALNLKFNISDTANKWVQNIYSRSDSLFRFKNGAETFINTLGGSSTTVNNIGSGFRWLATPGGDFKTTSPSNTILWDSVSTANTLTAKVDTSIIATQFDISSKLVNITGLISAGTNISLTGSGTSVAPYVINASGASAFSTNNTGTGFAWVATPSGNIKRAANSNTVLWDSVSTANSLTAKVDTSVIATQFDISGFGIGTVTNVSGTTNRITVTNPTTTPVIDIAATYVGQTSLTTLGTIATGTWNGTAIGATFGGTGQTTVTTGDLLYGSSTNTWSKLAGVATGNALISGGVATAPSWGKIGLTTHVSGILPVANGGTGTATPALIQGTNITITGTWPNQTINASGGASGTVTQVNTGYGLSGGPITTIGTAVVDTATLKAVYLPLNLNANKTIDQAGNNITFAGGGKPIFDSTKYNQSYSLSWVGLDSLVVNANSIGFGSAATVIPDSAYAGRLSNFTGLALVNISVSGTTAFQICAKSLAYINPGHNSMSTFCAGYNDIRATAATVKMYRAIGNAYDAALINNCVESYTSAQDCTTYGSWSNFNTKQDAGGKTTEGAYSSTLNDSIVTDVAGTNVYVGLIAIHAAARLANIYIDGVLVDIVDPSDGGYTESGGGYQPIGKYYTGLSNTSHHVKIIVGTGSNFLMVDYIGGGSSATKPFIFIDITKMDATGYAGGFATEAITNVVNDTIAARYARAAAAGLNVFHAITNNYFIATTSSGLSGDHIHPNDLGHYQIFSSIRTAITSTTASAGILLYANDLHFYGIDNTGFLKQIPYTNELTLQKAINNGGYLSNGNNYISGLGILNFQGFSSIKLNKFSVSNGITAAMEGIIQTIGTNSGMFYGNRSSDTTKGFIIYTDSDQFRVTENYTGTTYLTVDTTMRWFFKNNRLDNMLSLPTATIHIAGNRYGFANRASLKLDTSTLMATPERYAIEATADSLYWTNYAGDRIALNRVGGSGGSTIYTGDGTLTGNRTLTQGSNTLTITGTGGMDILGNRVLNLGTAGSPLSSVNVVSGGRLGLFSGITYGVDADNTDADYTVAANTIIAEVSAILTTDRTLTLPSASVNGQTVTLLMRYSTDLDTYSLSAAVTDNATGSTFTQLDWGKTYDFMVDQGLQWRLIRKY